MTVWLYYIYSFMLQHCFLEIINLFVTYCFWIWALADILLYLFQTWCPIVLYKDQERLMIIISAWPTQLLPEGIFLSKRKKDDTYKCYYFSNLIIKSSQAIKEAHNIIVQDSAISVEYQNSWVKVTTNYNIWQSNILCRLVLSRKKKNNKVKILTKYQFSTGLCRLRHSKKLNTEF